MREKRQGFPLASDYINNLKLAADTKGTVMIPDLARSVVITATENLWVRFGDGAIVASVPTADITDGSGSVLVPVQSGPREFHFLNSQDTEITMISKAGVEVSLEFFK